MAKKKSNEVLLRCPGEFSSLSIGDTVASVGVKIERSFLSDARARNLLCGRRVTGRIILGEGDPKQGLLIEDAEYEVAGVFDCKGLGMRPKSWVLRLAFSVEDVSVDDFAHFAKKKGQLVIEATEELADIDEDESADGDGEPDGGIEDAKPKRGRHRKATDEEIAAEQEKHDGKMAAAGK
jgi:hypothetical protein